MRKRSSMFLRSDIGSAEEAAERALGGHDEESMRFAFEELADRFDKKAGELRAKQRAALQVEASAPRPTDSEGEKP